MNFESDFDEISPVASVKRGTSNPSKNIISKTSSKIGKSAPIKSIKKMTGMKSNSSSSSSSKETKILEIVPICILQVVFGLLLKNVLDIRKRCKCSENKNLATLLIVLYALLLIVSGGSIAAVLIGYPMETVKKAIPVAMIGVFLITIMLTFAYIYKVEDKCDCPQTDNIYNILKLYFGFLVFLFMATILVYTFSYALD
jgi:hypothetical protein